MIPFIEFDQGGVITGTVLSSSGEPVSSAVRASCARRYGKAPKSLGFQTARTTDDRGIYRLYGLHQALMLYLQEAKFVGSRCL